MMKLSIEELLQEIEKMTTITLNKSEFNNLKSDYELAKLMMDYWKEELVLYEKNPSTYHMLDELPEHYDVLGNLEETFEVAEQDVFSTELKLVDYFLANVEIDANLKEELQILVDNELKTAGDMVLNLQ